MQPRYLKKSDLISTRTSRGRYPFGATTLWRKIREGKFPEPVVIAGIRCWAIEDLERWERAQLEGQGGPR
jgi:predicted DNA-binding transcriptional regulator AlpA